MRNLLFVVVFVIAFGSVETATAQVYPSRPITMIVPFAAGGGLDVDARIVSEHMSRTLGQRIVIENIAGAGGTTGSTRAMRANPDGYTIEIGNMGTHATAVALYPNLAYKPDIDFAPIGFAARLWRGGPMFAKRAILLAVTAVASFLYAEVPASAQSYPTRPITMIV